MPHAAHNPTDELAAVIAEYLETLERGASPDRGELVRRHPRLAAELNTFFADDDRLRKITTPLRKEVLGQHLALTWPASPTDENPPDENQRDDPSPPTESCQRLFGEYEIMREIARGGMGVVFQARHRKLGRVAALKLILAGRFASREDILRFEAEATAAAGLDHPGIVQVYEAGQHEGRHFITMAFVEGESLAQRLERGPLPPRDAARMLAKIADAVAFAHARGIIHRDLKPGNILLARATGEPSPAASDPDQEAESTPKITDFGLAKRYLEESHLTGTGQIVGTPNYMPPEQANTRLGEIGPAADIYALGAILYAMLTGRAPFQAANPLDVLLQVIENEPEPPRLLVPDIPQELDAICLKCLEKQPRARYDTAQSLVQDLQRFLKQEPVDARRRGVLHLLRRWGRRQPALAGHLLALGIVLFLCQVIFVLHPAREIVYHLNVTGLLAFWMVASAVLQEAAQNRRWQIVIRYGWAIADAVLLTALLYFLASPLGPLLIGYPLLIVSSGLFFQVRLVTVSTVAALFGYAALLLLRPEEVGAWRNVATFSVALGIVGLLVGYQVWRMRVLAHYYEPQTPLE